MAVNVCTFVISEVIMAVNIDISVSYHGNECGYFCEI
jgi:hypothetical protein